MANEWLCCTVSWRYILVISKVWVLASYWPCVYAASVRRTPIGCPQKLHPCCLISSFSTVRIDTYDMNNTNRLLVQSTGFGGSWKSQTSVWHLTYFALTCCIIVYYNMTPPNMPTEKMRINIFDLRAHRVVWDLDISCPACSFAHFSPASTTGSCD